MIEMQP